ncbi:MAG: ABC transporter ATP-binding protein [Balneolales bacterium]
MLESYKKFFSLFSAVDKTQGLLLFGLMFIGALLEVVGIGAIPVFVAVVADPDKIMQYDFVASTLQTYGITTSDQLLVSGAVALIVIYLVKNIYLAGLYYWKAKFVNDRQVSISTRLFSAYMKAPYTFHLQRNTAELLRNVNNEVKLIVEVLLNALHFIMQALMILAIFFLLLAVEPLISVVTLGTLGVTSMLFLQMVKKKIKKYGLEQQGHRRTMIQSINQGLGGLKDARILGREPYFLKKFTVSATRSALADRYISVANQLPKPFIETVAVIGMLLIALILVLQGRSVQSVIPVLTLFAVAVVRLMPAFRDLVSNFTSIRFNIFAVDPVYNDLKALENIVTKVHINGSSIQNPMTFKNSIKIENLHYRYPSSEAQALNGIDLVIPKGGSIAFVGASGAGKTTIVDVLLGLLPPSKGSIKVDGVDIKTNTKAWQSNIGYIPQFIYLSDDTIRRNIAFGLEDDEIEEDKLHNAIKAAQLDKLIQNLPNGYESLIGERGIMLSGGQRQRIGIARALYHNPKVLVMDEATSALDNVTEKYIIHALEKLRGDRTMIMIAHRLTTVKNCDKLYFMKDGVIEASGSHDELLERSSDFKLMAI